MHDKITTKIFLSFRFVPENNILLSMHMTTVNKHLGVQVSCSNMLITKDSYLLAYNKARGQGNSTVISVSVYQAGSRGSRPARSACIRRVEFFHCAIDSFPPVPTTG